MLRQWHRRVLGPDAANGHLQAGLVALMTGIVLGASGVALYLTGELTGIDVDLAWREAAIAMAALAAPMIFGGICLALPARPGLRVLAAVGAAVNVGAVVLFVLHYPDRFNAAVMGSDRAPMDAAVYALGTAILSGTLLAQIVGVYVRGRGAAEEDPWRDADYEVPDWLIEKDIDDAMARHPVQWGAGSAAGHSVEIAVHGFEDAVVRGQGAARRVSLKVPELQRKTDRLRGLGATSVEVPGTSMVAASTALGELRRLQAAHPRRYRPPRRSWWRRMLGLAR